DGGASLGCAAQARRLLGEHVPRSPPPLPCARPQFRLPSSSDVPRVAPELVPVFGGPTGPRARPERRFPGSPGFPGLPPVSARTRWPTASGNPALSTGFPGLIAPGVAPGWLPSLVVNAVLRPQGATAQGVSLSIFKIF